MKKNLFHALLGATLLILLMPQLFGQSSVKPIVLKKGEVLDILLLSQKSDTEADLKSYFQTAFPIAKRMSYQPLPGFKITKHTQGNHQPNNLILGKWSDLETREDFLTEIIKEVPDFHERRRKIWSYFGLCYFELQEDLSLEINRDKFHVATAYWLKTEDKSDEFYQKWVEKIEKMGGTMIVQLTNGTSPFGYHYQPSYFVISSWEDEAAFLAFQEKTKHLNIDNIQHVNEFILK
ncbi:MAG: hypothetical protein AB8F94_19870 [Saprospiraceae bacterium]